MSKSFDFCIDRARHPGHSYITDRNFEDAYEVPLYEIYKYFKENNVLQFGDEKLKVTVVYDPDAHFQYFTTSSLIHDGTSLFVLGAMRECLNKIFKANTYYSPIGCPINFNGAEVLYTIGNFVICNECGTQFAPKDKPWMQERTTVMLPILYNYKDGV